MPWGGGVEISLACDVRFAAAGVKLGLAEARIGAMPGAGARNALLEDIHAGIELVSHTKVRGQMEQKR